MPTFVAKPARVNGGGTKPIVIDEFIGRISTANTELSIALLRCPGGWSEPAQTPEFEEYTLVLKGMLRVAHAGGTLDVCAGQAIVTHPCEWVQYSTPEPEGAEYLAVCVPAFSLDKAHRDRGS
jgi:mannose-6-phosphate isomerase-like protein (cupin superfamily)